MAQFMDAMALDPSWSELGLRIVLAVASGALIGLNRQRGGHAAGLRTTILITLAACLAMIQANLLLSVRGRMEGGFASMDVLRLPLGVLTGVGFIGGGAILRRGDGVTGVTTAATIWIMTVVGLCFGGGQIVLGAIATAIAFVVIVPVKSIDRLIRRELDARLTLRAPGGIDPFAIAGTITGFGCEVRLAKLSRSSAGEADLTYALKWSASEPSALIEPMLKELGARFRIIELEMAATGT
ncbi:MAG: MgtC/SapB family protein [Acetobacteraceae bacterium]|nr:MgtC/SapB family protein [Acetobacteraceae bacterium]